MHGKGGEGVERQVNIIFHSCTALSVSVMITIMRRRLSGGAREALCKPDNIFNLILVYDLKTSDWTRGGLWILAGREGGKGGDPYVSCIIIQE